MFRDSCFAALALVAALASAAALGACRSDAPESRNSGGSGAESGEAAPVPAHLKPINDDIVLARGQAVWIQNCQRCHGTGLVGAPRIATEDWAPRAAKDLDTLFSHALGGFEGPTGSQMPARGGNPDLSDDDVKAAVRFMVDSYLSVSR